MRRVGLYAVALLLLYGCSGTRSDELQGDPAPVTTPDAGTMNPMNEPSSARRDPRTLSLEAAGGLARSPNHQLDFRVAAPILVVSNPKSGTLKGRTSR